MVEGGVACRSGDWAREEEGRWNSAWAFGHGILGARRLKVRGGNWWISSQGRGRPWQTTMRRKRVARWAQNKENRAEEERGWWLDLGGTQMMVLGREKWLETADSKDGEDGHGRREEMACGREGAWAMASGHGRSRVVINPAMMELKGGTNGRSGSTVAQRARVVASRADGGRWPWQRWASSEGRRWWGGGGLIGGMAYDGCTGGSEMAWAVARRRW